MIIEIPKGSYAPVFLARELAENDSTLTGTVHTRRDAAGPYRKWIIPLLTGALVLAIGCIIWQSVSSPYRRQQDVFLTGLHQSVSPSSLNFSVYDDLLGPLGLNPRRDALLVLSNPWIMTYYVTDSGKDKIDSADISIPVPNELKSAVAPVLRPTDRNHQFEFFHLTHQGYTGIGEAVAAFQVGRLMDLLGRRVHLTQGRFLNWDHVDKQDLILLGGPQSNDWSYEKDAKSNFGISNDGIVNSKPLTGEQPVYRSDPTTDYALVEKLTTPYNFETVLLAGVSSAGTAAAGEFLANPKKMSALYETLRGAAGRKNFPPDWEVLIKVTVRDGLPLESSVVAIRPATLVARK
jgi:hypothetical protein